jgi:hypothetical protein
MRPIEKVGLPTAAAGRSIVGLLLQRLGPYCSICERPLPDECWLWDKTTGAVLSSKFPLGADSVTDWDRFLVLDKNCAQSHEQRLSTYLSRLAGRLLLPDGNELSFRRGAGSPIEYQWTEVLFVVIDEDGQPIDKRDQRMVLAVGRTDEAIRTIEHFALNTRYFIAGSDNRSHEFRIPREELESVVDGRVAQRNHVWRMAQQMLETLPANIDNAPLPALIDDARRTIAGAGFWSTWASVLGERFSEETLLSLFSPRNRPDWTSGPGPHNTYPGTRQDWVS